MTKKIAVINDLSGFGRCSLTAAISVLSVMGVQACPLPTAILTAQTEYPSYYLDDYTDKMEHYRLEWEKMGQHFDGIYTGYVASETQIRQIFRFIDTFNKPDTFLLVDPVMGDNGHTYDMYTPSLLEQMQLLAKQADIITPNLTELCLLTGEDYQHLTTIQDTRKLMNMVRILGEDFCIDGPRDIIVTGIHFQDDDGNEQMGNLHINKESSSLFSFPYIGRHYSGTGDLFASCIAAGIARGDSIPALIKMAGEFLELALIDSVKEGVPCNDGTNYEQYLSLLLPDTDKRGTNI
ncbi:pyridoxamine kinase [Bariatricus sp. SGI.154]|uniref:pyridoxamine kinase n=1 Tax=Bariatricus sp. SGI.154 TaxID=3420549 RepID=UPI003D0270E7